MWVSEPRWGEEDFSRGGGSECRVGPDTGCWSTQEGKEGVHRGKGVRRDSI